MKKPVKRMLSICLSLVMLLSLTVPALAAYDTHGPVSTPLTVKNTNGRQLNFVDIYGGATKDRKDLSDTSTFYRDALLSNNTFRDWVSIAYNIFESQSKSYWDRSDKGWDEAFGKGHYMDFMDYMLNGKSKTIEEEGIANTNVAGVVATGLTETTSLREVLKEAADDIASLPNRKLDGDDFLARHKLDSLTNTNQTVFYSTVTSFDRYGRTPQIGYNSFSIAFYDFQLHVINSEDALEGEVVVSNGGEEDGLVTLYENYAANASTQSATLERGTTETLSSTISNSKSYTFGQSIGRSVNMGVKIPELVDVGLTVSASLSFGQAMETAYSEQNSITKTVDKSVTNTITVPPHTVAVGQQSISRAEVKTIYDCPVALSYKVAIFSLCGTCYDDNAAVQRFDTAGYEQRSFITHFGAHASAPDAVESLYQRATNHKNDAGYDKSYGSTMGTDDDGGVWCDELNWNAIINQGAPSSKKITGLRGGTDLIYALDDTYPMSLSGGSTTAYREAVHTVQSDPRPMYPIASVYIPWQTGEDMTLDRAFNLTVGETHPIHSYRVKSADARKDDNGNPVEYYGFVSTWGDWRVVDGDGQEVKSDVVEIINDPLTGSQTVVAKAPGTAHVKYFIPENTYYTYDGVASTNKNISSAVYAVVVTEAPKEEFAGSITVQGAAAVTVGVADNLNSMLLATAYDATGREADVPISWQAQELPSKGITVEENGAITTTKAGVFHVRAYCDNVYSDWVEVVSQEPEVLIESTCYHTFDDVPHNSQYDEAVEYVFQNQMMTGDGTSFSPEGQVDRAAMLQILYSAAGEPPVDGTIPFSDVSGEDGYGDAINWAAQNGIALGHGDGTFGARDGVTREQAAAFLCRYAQLEGLTLEGGGSMDRFQDAEDVSAWAKEYLSQAVEGGLFAGLDGVTLNPQSVLTRGELAVLMMNLFSGNPPA